MEYLIAYLEKDGTGFGSLPWIYDPCLDEFQTEIAIKEANFLKKQEYKRVTLFSIEGDRPEEIDWDFVEKNKIVETEPEEKHEDGINLEELCPITLLTDEEREQAGKIAEDNLMESVKYIFSVIEKDGYNLKWSKAYYDLYIKKDLK